MSANEKYYHAILKDRNRFPDMSPGRLKMASIMKGCHIVKEEDNNSRKHVLEFGVYEGKSMKRIMSTEIWQKYPVYGFDSFEGLPEDWNDFRRS